MTTDRETPDLRALAERAAATWWSGLADWYDAQGLYGGMEEAEDVEFAMACTPKTIIALCDQVTRLTATVDAYQRGLQREDDGTWWERNGDKWRQVCTDEALPAFLAANPRGKNDNG